MKKTFVTIFGGILLVGLLSSCRKDEQVNPELVVPVPEEGSTSMAGFYLLNEGNMNSNKASLDYYDYKAKVYRRNIYDQANPEIVKGLGDVGNDLGIYGSKLYVIVNASNKLEVLTCSNNRRLKTFTIQNCRSVIFDNGKAYVSAYEGTIAIGSNAPYGAIYQIDTVSMQITGRVQVGRQPEEMAIVDGVLYVANSGGYSPQKYERTLSQIDLKSFTRLADIDVDINLHRVRADAYGDLYVSSRGDYYGHPPKLYVVDTRTKQIKTSFDIAASALVIVRDTAYILSSAFSNTSSSWSAGYRTINVKTESLSPDSFIKDGSDKLIQKAYGLAVNPESGTIYVTDAKDYVSPGTLYGFNQQGIKLFSVVTGDIPAHIAFKR